MVDKRRLINAHYLADSGEFWGPTTDSKALRLNIQGRNPIQVAVQDVPEESRPGLILAGIRALLDNAATQAGGDLGRKVEAMQDRLGSLMADEPAFPKPRVVGGAGPSSGLTKTDEVLALTEDFDTPEAANEWRESLRDSMDAKDYNALMAQVRKTPEYKAAERQWEDEHQTAEAPRLSSLLGKGS